jgi:4'-phosphopantetheinyl transferase EntD
MAQDPLLQHAIEALAVDGISIDHRLIADGDELALLPQERDAFAGSVIKVQRASGAVRLVARGLLLRLGLPERAIPKSRSGMPVWPSGIVGSLAHDGQIAVAAVARERQYAGVGVDVEPAEALDPDLLGLIATASERETADGDPYRGRLLFAVKEAVYKAVNPLDGVFLDHHDVEVCLKAGTARVRGSRVVNFRYCVASHIVTLAFVSA